MTDDGAPIREHGGVVYGDDPFNGNEEGRPWLVLSNQEEPFHDDQYIALTLTMNPWMDGLIDIPEES